MQTPIDRPDGQFNEMSEPPMPIDGEAWALFLDVDGTLAPIAGTPAETSVPAGVVARLHELHAGLGGALALVSGRPIVDVDRLVAPARLPVIGVHGAEWRLAGSGTARAAAQPAAVDAARHAFAAFVQDHPGTLLEDKAVALALHFRRNPAAAAAAVRLARRLVAASDADTEVLQGHMVVEIRPRGVDKGTAVRAFLAVAPFAGRRPVYIGDDVTDEDAFAVVNELSGISVAVGLRPHTGARYRLESVPTVHAWLERLARHVQPTTDDE